MERTDPVQPATDIDPAPNPAVHEDDDPIIATEKNAKGEDVVSVGTVIHHRKEAKAARRELADTRAKLEQVTGQIAALQPILERIQQDPTLLQRAAGHPESKPAERDVEAEQLAEDFGFIASDGALDVARARRVIERIDQRAGRTIDARVAPLAQTTAQQISTTNRQTLVNARTPEGVPLATQESIDEIWRLLPPELTANSQVASMVLPLMAMGMDKAKGRAPKAPDVRYYDDPITTLSGGRAPASVLTDEDRRMLQHTPKVSDKELEKMVTTLAQNGRRGVALE